jgi:hypothetical protein
MRSHHYQALEGIAVCSVSFQSFFREYDPVFCTTIDTANINSVAHFSRSCIGDGRLNNNDRGKQLLKQFILRRTRDLGVAADSSLPSRQHPLDQGDADRLVWLPVQAGPAYAGGSCRPADSYRCRESCACRPEPGTLAGGVSCAGDHKRGGHCRGKEGPPAASACQGEQGHGGMHPGFEASSPWAGHSNIPGRQSGPVMSIKTLPSIGSCGIARVLLQ